MEAVANSTIHFSLDLLLFSFVVISKALKLRKKATKLTLMKGSLRLELEESPFRKKWALNFMHFMCSDKIA